MSSEDTWTPYSPPAETDEWTPYTPPAPQDKGFLNAATSGLKAAVTEGKQSYQALTGQKPTQEQATEAPSVAEQSLELSDVLHPKALAEKTLYGLAKSSPTLGAAILGGAAGAATPLPGGAAVGTVLGGAVGSGLQAIGPAYSQQLQKLSPDEMSDPAKLDQAYKAAKKQAIQEGAITGASFALFELKPFEWLVKSALSETLAKTIASPAIDATSANTAKQLSRAGLKDLALQAAVVQPAASAAGYAYQQNDAGQPITGEGLASAALSGATGTLLPAIAGKAVGAVKDKMAVEPPAKAFQNETKPEGQLTPQWIDSVDKFGVVDDKGAVHGTYDSANDAASAAELHNRGYQQPVSAIAVEGKKSTAGFDPEAAIQEETAKKPPDVFYGTSTGEVSTAPLDDAAVDGVRRAQELQQQTAAGEQAKQAEAARVAALSPEQRVSEVVDNLPPGPFKYGDLVGKDGPLNDAVKTKQITPGDIKGVLDAMAANTNDQRVTKKGAAYVKAEPPPDIHETAAAVNAEAVAQDPNAAAVPVPAMATAPTGEKTPVVSLGIDDDGQHVVEAGGEKFNPAPGTVIEPVAPVKAEAVADTAKATDPGEIQDLKAAHTHAIQQYMDDPTEQNAAVVRAIEHQMQEPVSAKDIGVDSDKINAAWDEHMAAIEKGDPDKAADTAAKVEQTVADPHAELLATDNADDPFEGVERRVELKNQLAEKYGATDTPEVFASPDNRMGALITPEPDGSGRWRATWFDKDGFSGDSPRANKAEAVKLALDEGYRDTNRELLKEFQKLPSFDEGNAKTEAIRKENEERAKPKTAESSPLPLAPKTIKNLKGESVPPPREFYRGVNLGDDRRIKTGNDEWDGYLFVTDTEKGARPYGKDITKFTANPDANIIYEGTPAWRKLIGEPKKNESLLDYAVRASRVAKNAGYDAAWFKRQTDIGTPIFNKDKFSKQDIVEQQPQSAPILRFNDALKLAGDTSDHYANIYGKAPSRKAAEQVIRDAVGKVTGKKTFPFGSLTAEENAKVRAILEERANATSSAPIKVETKADRAAVREQVHPEPSSAQIEAGNYPKGHMDLHGLDISIENPKGGVRQGVDPTGKAWKTTMPEDYGYIRGTLGKDKDHVDIYVGDHHDSKDFYVIDQIDPKTGKFDEHKVVTGVNSMREAEALYDKGFSDRSGPSRRGAIAKMGLDKFKEWVYDKTNTSKPIAETVERENAKRAVANKDSQEFFDRTVFNADLKHGTAENLVDMGMGKNIRFAKSDDGEWSGHGNILMRKGVDPEFDGLVKKQNPDSVSSLPTLMKDANKAYQEADWQFAHNADDKSPDVVYGKLPDGKWVGMDGRLFDYARRQGLDIKFSDPNSLIALEKDGKLVGMTTPVNLKDNTGWLDAWAKRANEAAGQYKPTMEVPTQPRVPSFKKSTGPKAAPTPKEVVQGGKDAKANTLAHLDELIQKAKAEKQAWFDWADKAEEAQTADYKATNKYHPNRNAFLKTDAGKEWLKSNPEPEFDLNKENNFVLRTGSGKETKFTLSNDPERLEDFKKRLKALNETVYRQHGSDAEPGEHQDNTLDFMARHGDREDVHQAAREYLGAETARDDKEHAVAIDAKTGNVIEAATTGRHSSVGFSDKTSDLLNDPNQHIVTHHSHTEEYAPSLEDVAALHHEGEAAVVVHTPKNTFSVALSDKINPSAVIDATRLKYLYNTANKILKPFVEKLVENGHIDDESADLYHGDLTNRALAAAGILDYQSSLPLPKNILPQIKNALREAATGAHNVAAESYGFFKNEGKITDVHQFTGTTGNSETLGKLPYGNAFDQTTGRGRYLRNQASGDVSARAPEEGRLTRKKQPRSLTQRAEDTTDDASADRGGNPLPRQEAIDAVRSTWKEMGLPEENLQLLDRVDASKDALRNSGGNDEMGAAGVTHGEIAGVALDTHDPASTAAHEGFHVLENAGAITGDEIRAMTKESEAQKKLLAKYMPDLDVDAMSHKELRAYGYELYRQQNRALPNSLPVFQRVARFLQGVYNKLRRAGLESSDDVYKSVLAGERGDKVKAATHEEVIDALDRMQNGREQNKDTLQYQAAKKAIEDVHNPDKPTPKTAYDVATRMVARGIAKLPVNVQDWLNTKMKGLLAGVNPMASGDADAQGMAKRFKNYIRTNVEEYDQAMRWMTDKWGTKNPAYERMFRAIDEGNYRAHELMDQGKTLEEARDIAGGEFLDTIKDPEERAIVKAYNNFAESIWKKGVEDGLLEGQGQPFWAPHTIAFIDPEGNLVRDANNTSGDGLSTNASSLLKRKYMKYDDAIAAANEGLEENQKAVGVPDIRMMVHALYKVQNALAGRQLIKDIKDMGALRGIETTSTIKKPGFSATNHPAFTEVGPVPKKEYLDKLPKGYTEDSDGNVYNKKGELVNYTREKDGTYSHYTYVKDEDGKLLYERKQLYVNDMFSGPLKAVLTDKPGAWYQMARTIQNNSMGLIMYSPFIHLQTVSGKAMAKNPVKGLMSMFRGGYDSQGATGVADRDLYRKAMLQGLAPPAQTLFDHDVMGTILSPDKFHGKSWPAKLLGAAFDRVSPEAGDKVRKGFDKFDDTWHQKLLWDRVRNIQMGIWMDARRDFIKQGMNEDAAGWVAAHLANRLVGSIPSEAMSDGLRKFLNLIMFSRSFTFTNLALFKDALVGLPADVRNNIEKTYTDADAAAGAINKARMAAGMQASKSVAKAAAAAILLDMGLNHVMNSIIQSAFDSYKFGQNEDEIANGYEKRMGWAVQAAKDNPAELAAYMGLGMGVGGVKGAMTGAGVFALSKLDPTTWHEPGKESRILVGYEPSGRANYTRIAAGKVGEDLYNWMTSPFQTAHAKMSSVAKPAMEAYQNQDSFGNPIYDKAATGYAEGAQAVGKVVQHVVSGLVPLDQAKAFYHTVTGSPTDVDISRTIGGLTGFTASRGAPQGPVGGFEASVKRNVANRQKIETHDIIDMLKHGEMEDAKMAMDAVRMTPIQQRNMVQRVLGTVNMKTQRQVDRWWKLHGSDEEKERAERIKAVSVGSP